MKPMTEIDISKVLIEGDYATIMGVKYKRVEESKPRMTLENAGKYEVVSYNDKVYYRLEYPTAIIWYKRKDDNNAVTHLKQITDGETHRLLEGVWFNDVKHGKYDDEPTKPMDEMEDIMEELGLEVFGDVDDD